jgi:hypothetical protein
MPDSLDVTSSVQGDAVILRVRYGANQMLRGDSEILAKELISKYEVNCGNLPSARHCIVVVEAPYAGSLFVKALFKLYEQVRDKGGRVICAQYPDDYIDTLLTLGLPQLPGFDVVDGINQALGELANAPG